MPPSMSQVSSADAISNARLSNMRLDRHARVAHKARPFREGTTNPMAIKKTAARPKSVAAKAAATATKATATKAVAPVITITTKQLGAQLADAHGLSKRDMDAILASFVASVVKHVKKGAKVRINGLGILQVKKRAARLGRNPQNGASIKIKASKKLAFRVAKDLKDQI
jgi:DNA-binding protein HU-beta